MRPAQRRAGGPALAAALLVLAAGPVPPAAAQVSLSNLLLVRAGNEPFAEPTDKLSLYDQVNLEARWGDGMVGGRFELFDQSLQTGGYREFTQRYAEWSRDDVRLRVGNFYSLLGRGLVHRAWELPGLAFEPPDAIPGQRPIYGFSRDDDGVLVEAARGRFSMRLLGGRPSFGDAPPGEEATLERYRGWLAGGQAAVELHRGSRVGATYLRLASDDGSRQDHLGSGFVELDPLRLLGGGPVALPIYAEYAQANRSFGEWWSFETGDTPHALYLSGNLLWGPFGLSAEWKDYRGFRLGVNDPPSLVREHSFALPNRGTHVLDADDETGYQLEGSWTFDGLGVLTANRSRAWGTPGVGELVFDETYVEALLAPRALPALELALYIHAGRDGFDFVSDRDGAGGTLLVRLPRELSLALDLEGQRVERVPDVTYFDRYGSLSLARSGWGSLGLVWEHTTDPDEEAPEDFGGPVDPRRYLSGVLRADLGRAHVLTMSWGERRGGRACTAGTCYEVQPFDGVEARLTSRF